MSLDAQKLLEKGIKYQDWELIAEAQKLLAGTNVSKIVLPTESKNVEDEDESLEPELEEDEEEEIPQDMPDENFKMQIRKDDSGGRTFVDDEGNVHKICKRERIDKKKIKINLFDLEEMDAEQPSEDLSYASQEKKGKRKSTLVLATCGRCEKKFKVSPILAPKIDGDNHRQYTCDKCAGRKRILS